MTKQYAMRLIVALLVMFSSWAQAVDFPYAAVAGFRNPKTGADDTLAGAHGGWGQLYPATSGGTVYTISSSSVSAGGLVTYYYQACPQTGGCSNGGPQTYQLTALALSCPLGGTLSGSQCLGCPAAGSAYGSAAYFNYGTSATNTNSLKMSCTASRCAVIFVGSSPAGRSLVNGVFNYFALGVYEYVGPAETCTPSGTNFVPGSVSSIPANTCTATETPQTFNGVVRCVVKSTGAVSSNSPPAPTVGTVTTEQTLADGIVLKTHTTTYGDGSQSIKSEVLPSASATQPTSSQTTINGGPGSFADKAVPGVLSGAGSGSGGGTATVEFPSDYARAGEASAAAQSINSVLGPKLDKIVETGTDPTDPTQPQGSEFDQAFFQGTFTNLLGWQMPAHSSQCPTSSFSFNSQSYTMDAHCQLVANHFSVLASVMSVVWTVLALFILLGA